MPRGAGADDEQHLLPQVAGVFGRVGGGRVVDGPDTLRPGARPSPARGARRSASAALPGLIIIESSFTAARAAPQTTASVSLCVPPSGTALWADLWVLPSRRVIDPPGAPGALRRRQAYAGSPRSPSPATAPPWWSFAVSPGIVELVWNSTALPFPAPVATPPQGRHPFSLSGSTSCFSRPGRTLGRESRCESEERMTLGGRGRRFACLFSRSHLTSAAAAFAF